MPRRTEFAALSHRTAEPFVYLARRTSRRAEEIFELFCESQSSELFDASGHLITLAPLTGAQAQFRAQRMSQTPRAPEPDPEFEWPAKLRSEWFDRHKDSLADIVAQHNSRNHQVFEFMWSPNAEPEPSAQQLDPTYTKGLNGWLA